MKPSFEAFHKSFQTNNAMSKVNITEESCAKKVSSIVVSGKFSVEQCCVQFRKISTYQQKIRNIILQEKKKQQEKKESNFSCKELIKTYDHERFNILLCFRKAYRLSVKTMHGFRGFCVQLVDARRFLFCLLTSRTKVSKLLKFPIKV